jgi:hypothetical protein
MVTPGVLALDRQQDITLIKAVARAFRWRRMLETSRFSTINELAAAEKINPSYVSRVLRLTLLAPDVVEVILDGRQPEGMTLPGLLLPFPPEWSLQGGQGWVRAQRGHGYISEPHSTADVSLSWVASQLDSPVSSPVAILATSLTAGNG